MRGLVNTVEYVRHDVILDSEELRLYAFGDCAKNPRGRLRSVSGIWMIENIESVCNATVSALVQNHDTDADCSP